MRNAVPRVVAFSIVALLHVVVLILIWQRRAPERETQSYLTWINIEPQAEVRPPEPDFEIPAREQNFVVRPPRVPPLEPPSQAISAPFIDWRASMEASATAAAAEIIRRQAYQPLGPIAPRESGSSSSESVFEQPKHKAGDIDHDPVQGRTLVWHNERCYTELKFPTIKDPNALVGASNPPKCMYPIGKRKPRDDLFDDINER